MTSLVNPVSGQYLYQYDNMGRLNGMSRFGAAQVAAGYGAAGQLTNLSYGGVSETFSYNSLLQVTGMTAQIPYYGTQMNMQYNYSATQNNGRIATSNDGVTGENVTYTYDALNRLTGASAGSLWGEAYGY